MREGLSVDDLTRKEALQRFIVMPALAAALSVGTTTLAEAKGPKSQFKYQDHPNGSNKCSECQFFAPGKSKTANGTCSVVAGSISPNGWCTAFSAKS
jgi:hypothetical protein